MNKNIEIIEITKRELSYFCVNDYWDMLPFIESIAKKHNIKVNSYDEDSDNYLIECKTDEAIRLSVQLEILNINHKVYYGD